MKGWARFSSTSIIVVSVVKYQKQTMLKLIERKTWFWTPSTEVMIQ